MPRVNKETRDESDHHVTRGILMLCGSKCESNFINCDGLSIGAKRTEEARNSCQPEYLPIPYTQLRRLFIIS